MRITARYESAAALAADVESQLGHGGLLVRGEVPAKLEQFAAVELAVVCGGDAVVVAAQVLQFFPGVGVAVAVDAAARARIAGLAAGTPAPTAVPVTSAAARAAAATADTVRAGRTPDEDLPTARVSRTTTGPRPADEEVPTAPRVARTTTGAPPTGAAQVPRPRTPTGAQAADGSQVPRARTPTGAQAADGSQVPRARTPTGAQVADGSQVPRARTPTGAPAADGSQVPRARTPTGTTTATTATTTTAAPEAADPAVAPPAARAAAGMVEKIQRALKGDRETRFAILRDVNRAVHIHVLRNPGLMIDEIAAIARMPTVSVEALAQIATRREWGHRPEIAIALVRNPTVPVPVAIELLAYVSEADLKQLAKDNRTRDPVQRAARRKLLK